MFTAGNRLHSSFIFASQAAQPTIDRRGSWLHRALVRSAPLLIAFACQMSAATDSWNQWRGPQRDGVLRRSPPLLDALPDDGLQPLWIRRDELPKVKSGGWSSPVVSNGAVYIYAHHKQKVGNGKLPANKFPYLPPERRTGMSPEEYAEYERNRRDEQERRSRHFQFTETIYCLDAQSGEITWKYQTNSEYTRFAQSGCPAVVDGRVYHLGAARVVRAVNAADGGLVWEQKLPGEFRDQHLQSSPLVVGDTVVVQCGPLFGLNAATGEVRWSHTAEKKQDLHSSPVVWSSPNGPRIVAHLSDRETICVDPGSGRAIWKLASEVGHATPVVSGDLLITYGNSRKRGLRCYRLSDTGAEERWAYRGLSDPGSSPVVLGDAVYVQGGRKVACVNLDNGNVRWSAPLERANPRYTSLVAVDGKVFYGFEGLLCFAADATEYRPLFDAQIDNAGRLAERATFERLLGFKPPADSADLAQQRESQRQWQRHFNQGPVPCATPAVADGRLYIRLKNGIVCYQFQEDSNRE